MSYSNVTYTGNGVTTAFNVPFPYLNQSDVSVTVAGLVPTFTWLSSSQLQITPAPANGAQVYVFRTTNLATANVSFTDGYTLRAADLNAANTQLLYSSQEQQDQNFALVAAAKVQTGQLPVVTSANNGSMLYVVGGAWTVATLAATNGGLTYSNGLVVRGVQVVTADPGSPLAGDRWYNSTLNKFRSSVNGLIVGDVSKVLAQTVLPAALSNTTVATAVGTPATLVAGCLSTGKVLRVRFAGCGTTNGASPTLSCILYKGPSLTIIDQQVAVPLGTAANFRFSGEVFITIMSDGVSGTFLWAGSMVCFTSSANLVLHFGPNTIPVTTQSIDTTILNTLQFGFQWSVAAATNSVVLHSFIVDIEN